MSSTTGVYRCTPGCAGLTHASTTREPRIDAVLYPQVDIICTSTTNHSGWSACTMTDLKTESHLYTRESCGSCFAEETRRSQVEQKRSELFSRLQGVPIVFDNDRNFLLSAETANRFVGILREITLSECSGIRPPRDAERCQARGDKHSVLIAGREADAWMDASAGDFRLHGTAPTVEESVTSRRAITVDPTVISNEQGGKYRLSVTWAGWWDAPAPAHNDLTRDDST
ncbi:hypothetical protein EHS25_002079 [Saitozyma podzolica]|uniref:Uncharacterized protein n=1 Tax=Saitozyma podzolica TaxID=1890683 RepID=A0A427YED1_9TREE|nr:hypothetical protein EHS25_002079 [Saitozyma podzolica]